jgi:beta-lactamase class A
MNRRNSPGAGQWLTVSLFVVATVFLLLKLLQYATVRSNYPAGLTIAGVDVGGLSEEEASQVLINQFIEAPVILHHTTENFEMSPTRAKFQLDIEAMLRQADYEQEQQDFWAGFWGFLWGRPVEVNPVPLLATHDREALRDVLTDIKVLMDQPAQPAQPVPQAFSFQYGETGMETDIEASFGNIEAALYRHTNREAWLDVKPSAPLRPEKNLLTRLLVNNLQEYERLHNGVASMFVLDLVSGDEIAINANIPMSGMDLLKVPIVLELYRELETPPTLTQREIISSTLSATLENEAANELLRMISGEDDPYVGARRVTDSLQRLGLQNSFIVVPYDMDARAGIVAPQTEANQMEDLRTNPNRYVQTTAEDMGSLLSMLYYCAEGKGGALQAVYGEQLTSEECRTIVAFMVQNQIDSLIEEGVPPGTAVAHRHGWISDTHADAAIIYSPGGNYVIVQMLYKPNWLEWEVSSPLLANLSRATYNYFNFDNPYLGGGSTTN